MRDCLLPPIPELERAISSLDLAVSSVLKRDTVRASQLIVDANLAEIREYTARIVGKLSVDVHRRTALPATVPNAERFENRMPAASKELQIFVRDGWRCRFCAVRVISRQARKLLCDLFPRETRWELSDAEKHTCLYAIAASLDHVLPYSRGGDDDVTNLVTACYCCQFGRGNFTLSEVELNDPRDRPPQVTGWDGLSRLIAFQRGAT